MDERKNELKRLRKKARRAKRKFVTAWKILSVFLLVIALVSTPLCFVVHALDNVAAVYLGGKLWKTMNADENAQYFIADFSDEESLQAHLNTLSAQVAAEGAVLLLNENNALPLTADEKFSMYYSELEKEPVEADVAVAVLLRTDSDLLQRLSEMKAAGEIKKIIVLLTASQPQVGFLKDNAYKIDGALWIGSAAAGVEEVLTGKIGPSGRLPDTLLHADFAADTDYEACYETFVSGGDNAEDFSYGNTVAYPFGYGLSYTAFHYSDMQVVYNEKTGKFAVTVTVTNTGAVEGKETVQVYAQAADGLTLAGFAKTQQLAAGESRSVTVYVDEVGEGPLYLTVAADSHAAMNNILAAKGFAPEKTEGRMDAAGDAGLAYYWQEEKQAKTAGGKTESADNEIVEMPTLGAQNNLKLHDMIGISLDDPKWQTFLDQLTFEDMAAMVADAYGGFPALESVQSPGTRHQKHLTGFPSGDVLAATFNTELAYDLGKAVGNYCLLRNINCLYDPCGEPAEFSRDNFLAGKICGSLVLGIQDKGVVAAITLDRPGIADDILRESKAGGILGDVGAEAFTGMVISEKTDVESVLTGVTVFDTWRPSVKELEGYRDDPAVVWAMRKACQNNLYTLANSAAMNGMGKDTTVEAAVLSAQVICRAVAAGSWVLAVLFACLWIAGVGKWKKTQAYLDYKTMKNTQKELKKAQK